MRSGQADHEDSVARLYERYASRISAYALRRTPSSDAADVVSETFLVAWRRSDVIPAEPDTLPWLYGVARHVLANQRRSRRRRGRLRDRLAREFDGYSAITASVESTEEFQRVARALEQLPLEDAELLRLIAWEALNPAEIAVMMGIESNAARQRIHRARKRLRSQLATDGFDEGEFPTVAHAVSERCTAKPGSVSRGPLIASVSVEVSRNGR